VADVSEGNAHSTNLTDRCSIIDTSLSSTIEVAEDEEDEDEAVDLFDLTAAIPADTQPIGPLKKKKKKQLKASDMPYYSACKQNGSDTSSGESSSTDESSNSLNEWLDKEPVMTQKQMKKVQKYMLKVTGIKRHYK
jgi:hypothetical protein